MSTEVMVAMSVFILFMMLMIAMVVAERHGHEKWVAEKKHTRLMKKLWEMDEA